VIYSMGVSLDGFIAGPNGEIDWSAPDEELHRFHNEQTRELGAQLCGRRLYEEMLYWETADENPSATEYELEFARIWQDLPKIVFSTTLEKVEGNARLVKDRVAEEVAKLKEEPGKDLAVGGAGLASHLVKLGLVDEFRPSSVLSCWVAARRTSRRWTTGSTWSSSGPGRLGLASSTRAIGAWRMARRASVSYARCCSVASRTPSPTSTVPVTASMLRRTADPRRAWPSRWIAVA
jgi:dihydrofolate reductase